MREVSIIPGFEKCSLCDGEGCDDCDSNGVVRATPVNGGGDDESELLDLYGVFRFAMERFLERNGIYKDLWKDGGWPDSANHVRHKSARVALCKTGLENHDELATAVDDAIDLINYGAFFILNIIANRPGEATG